MERRTVLIVSTGGQLLLKMSRKIFPSISFLFSQIAMSKKIVLKVDITADRCKAGAMSTIAGLSGIKSMAVDGEKGTLTVVGDVDVVCLASMLRKAKFQAQVVSVGPAEEKKPDPPKPPEEPKKDPPKPPHCCCPGPCNSCCPPPMPSYRGAAMVCYDEEPDSPRCIIM